MLMMIVFNLVTNTVDSRSNGPAFNNNLSNHIFIYPLGIIYFSVMAIRMQQQIYTGLGKYVWAGVNCTI